MWVCCVGTDKGQAVEEIQEIGTGGSENAETSVRVGTTTTGVPFAPPGRQAEEASEISRIKSQVVQFKEAGASGVSCTYWRESEKLRTPAVYCLDKLASALIVLSGDNLDCMEVLCPLDSILELYGFQDSDAKYFPKAVVDMVPAEDAKSLLMIVFKRKRDGVLIRFCLSLQSTEACCTFIECIGVLSVCLANPK